MASVHDHDNDAAFGKELLVYNRPPLSPLAQAVVYAHYGAPAMTTPNRAQRLLDEFHEGATKWDGGFSIRHGLAAVLLHIKATEQDAESFYAIPQDRLESLVDELTAPTLIEQAMLGDRDAARRFLHEAGFTDASGNWLPQYQPLEEADD